MSFAGRAVSRRRFLKGTTAAGLAMLSERLFAQARYLAPVSVENPPWPAGASAFDEIVERYANFHWQHMRKEEKELLPLAERSLTTADWREIERAFAANEDPVADVREQDFNKLFQRIVSIAPALIGVGEPWKQAVP